MQDPADYDLRPTEPTGEPEPAVRSRSRGPWSWIIAIGIAAAALIVTFLVVARQQAASPVDGADTAEAAASPYQAPVEPSGTLGAPAEPVYLPPLGEADHVVRPLVSALSSHPRVLRLLTTDGLIRRFVVSIENIANGQTPAAHLQAIRPAGRYEFIDHEEVVLADPRGYARYDDIATAFASVDVRGAARLYTMLKPRLDEAYRDLGHPGSFDRAMEQAFVSLLSVPVVPGDVYLEPHGALFRYADPALEALTPAQRQLLRMGPANVRRIQGQLRELATALGVAPGRLPARAG